MEKKSYVAPQCLVVELGVMNMIAASIEVNASSKDGEHTAQHSDEADDKHLYTQGEDDTHFTPNDAFVDDFRHVKRLGEF